MVDQIQEAILDGSLKPGDMLPSEMKLKDMFDTSRGTIREAMRVLEQKGLIDIKIGVGGGAVVKAVDTGKMTESLELLIQSHKVSLDHLTEFREGVEGMVAALAAERASKADIKRLKKLLVTALDRLEDVPDGWMDFIDIDIRLHVAIAEIAGNPIFSAVLHMVHENILGSYERFALRKEENLRENYQDLCAIVSAIESGSVNEARFLAQHHVRKFKEYMKVGNL